MAVHGSCSGAVHCEYGIFAQSLAEVPNVDYIIQQSRNLAKHISHTADFNSTGRTWTEVVGEKRRVAALQICTFCRHSQVTEMSAFFLYTEPVYASVVSVDGMSFEDSPADQAYAAITLTRSSSEFQAMTLNNTAEAARDCKMSNQNG